MKFTYLRSNLTSKRNLDKEVGKLVLIAKSIAGWLNNSIWNNKQLPRETKMKF